MRGSAAGTRGRRTGGRPTGELSQAAARAGVSAEEIRQKSPARVEEQHQEGEPGDAEALPGGGKAIKHLRRKGQWVRAGSLVPAGAKAIIFLESGWEVDWLPGYRQWEQDPHRNDQSNVRHP